MERLHTLDAEFLYLEDASSPMHIAGLCIFEGPAPERAQIASLCRTLLHDYPRYRQRLRRPLLGLGAPAWEDDPRFELDYHLRFTALPSPHDDGALSELMGRVLSQLLDRRRPLWECWVVEGLEGDRWAMISKVHHSLIDGQSGVSLLKAWFDGTEPEASWHAAPNVPRGGRNLPALAIGLGRLAWSLRPRARKSIQGSIGSHRSYDFLSIPLAEVQQIRAVFGGSVNDVALSSLAGAYRTLMLSRGDDVNDAPLRALVPLSTRAGTGQGMTGNRLAAWFCELPTNLADPVQRLAALSRHTRELKGRSHMGEASDWLVHLGDHVPAWLLAAATRTIGQVMHWLPQRSIATIATHVRGPEKPLFCLGRRLLAYYPYVPIMQGMRVGTAILSYDGVLAYGITSDYDSVREPGVMRRALATEHAKLLSRAKAWVASSDEQADRA